MVAEALVTVESVANGIWDVSESISREEIVRRLQALLASQPAPATCPHEWVQATVEACAAGGVALDAVVPNGQWCGRCRSLRREPPPPVDPTLTPTERVTIIVADAISRTSGTPAFEGVTLTEVVHGLLFVAADTYVNVAVKGATPKQVLEGWLALTRDVLKLSFDQSRTSKGGLQLVR
jgi:hypothetical protein